MEGELPIQDSNWLVKMSLDKLAALSPICEIHKGLEERRGDEASEDGIEHVNNSGIEKKKKTSDLVKFEGVFKATWFGLVDSASGKSSSLIRYICADLNTANTPGEDQNKPTKKVLRKWPQSEVGLSSNYV